jgi:ferredoxin
MKFRVSDRCSGHGQCYSFYGDLFQGDELGFNVAREGPPVPVPAELEERAGLGVRICPEGAIALTVE